MQHRSYLGSTAGSHPPVPSPQWASLVPRAAVERGGSKGLSLGHSKGQETLVGQLRGSSATFMQAKGLEL